MKRVWIVQCLCPERHCIVGAAKEADGRDEAGKLIQDLRKAIADMVEAKTLNPWCGLCRAPDTKWTFDLRETEWASLEEAEGPLRQEEARNIATGVVLGELLGPRNRGPKQ